MGLAQPLSLSSAPSQGKIEHSDQTMENVVKLQHYSFPSELEASLRDFIPKLRLLP